MAPPFSIVLSQRSTPVFTRSLPVVPTHHLFSLMPRFTRLVVLLAVPAALRAQASPPIDPLERVYRDIDRLASLGLIDDLIVGQRPLSERQIGRLLTEAQSNLARLTSPSATE